MAEGKEPFVGNEDRPDVELKPDMPVTEMRVRDLSALLQQSIVLKKREFKDFIKDIKNEKIEIKDWKEWKFEIKEFKFEKFEKNEKIELEPGPKGFEPGPKLSDPGPGPGPIEDPRIDRLIDMVSKLSSTVENLAGRVEKLEQRKQ
jgi:hypothetical protein